MNKQLRLGIAITLTFGILLAQQPVAQGPQASNAAAWLTSVTTWASGTLGAMANYGTSPGAVLVPGVNSFVTNTVTVTGSGGTFPVTGNINPIPQSTSTYALLDFDLAATAATNVKGSAGNVWGFYGFNPNATTCFLQFYNSASASLGTSALHPFGVVAGGSFVYTSSIALANYTTAISTGQTTTATGATPCTTAMPVTILYD
jgi:hypothetical protein